MTHTDARAPRRTPRELDIAAAPRLARLLPDDASAETLRDAYGRILWSLVAEPGDRHAGALVGALGPACAEAMIDGRRAELLGEYSAATGEAPGREWASAFDRWESRRTQALELAGRVCSAGAHLGARIVVPGMEHWPGGLDDLGVHAPLLVWVRGRMDVLSGAEPSLALVGARASTPYGDTVAGEIAADAVDAGIAIVSGGAYGIDAMAHRGALTSHGRTIAVVAGGVDRLYPSGNRVLFERIEREGAIVSELAPGASPTRWRFLQRNRVIAALARATVVVEAGARSGALNTAHHALELGRPVGAVPGSVLSAASAGTHRLIAEGLATLVSGPDAAIELYRDGLTGRGEANAGSAATGDGADGADARIGGASGSLPVPDRALPPPRNGAPVPAPAPPRASPAAIRAWDALGARRGRPVDEIASRAGLSGVEARSALAELELAGHAQRGADGVWRRRAGKGRPD